jgi:hypothetical protein
VRSSFAFVPALVFGIGLPTTVLRSNTILFVASVGVLLGRVGYSTIIGNPRYVPWTEVSLDGWSIAVWHPNSHGSLGSAPAVHRVVAQEASILVSDERNLVVYKGCARKD